METSALSLATVSRRAARRHAIVYVLAASATFTLGSALVKALTAQFPVLENVLFRSIVGFLAMLPMIIRHGGLSALATRRPLGHSMRTVYGFIGTVDVGLRLRRAATGHGHRARLCHAAVPYGPVRAAAWRARGSAAGDRRAGRSGRCAGDVAAVACRRQLDAVRRGGAPMMTHKPDPTFAAAVAWLRTHHLPYRQVTRYQLKIGRSVSFYPHRGTIFVDGEDEAREQTGLAALETALREQGYLGGPTAPPATPRRPNPAHFVRHRPARAGPNPELLMRDEHPTHYLGRPHHFPSQGTPNDRRSIQTTDPIHLRTAQRLRQ